MNTEFKKVHTTKDLTISLAITAVGVALSFVHMGLGITIAACGILCLLIYKGGYKAEGCDELLSKSAFDAAISCRNSAMEFLEGKSNDIQLKEANNGGVIRLEVYYCKKNSIAYAQLFDFSNYVYAPVTEIIRLDGERADKLISNLL